MKALFLAVSLASAAVAQEAPVEISAPEAGIGRLVPNLKVGRADLRAFKAPTVIAFTSTSCPVTKRYAPTLAAMEKEYSKRGVKFVFVNPIATDKTDAKAFSGIFLHDKKREVAAALGARSTAEVFVLDAARTLVYRGAIDDQYGVTYSKEAPRKRYLVEALESVLKNEKPVVAATSAPGCVLEHEKRVAKTPLTYHARVSRIVQQNCVECHRDGGVAPFSLEKFEDVVSHAGMIRKQVEKGAMPPWFAAPAHPNPWANDRSLSEEDKKDFLTWLAGDRKEGDKADAPRPLVFASEWRIGKPDAIIQISKPIAVKESGTMPYQVVYVDTDFEEEKWAKAVEIRPTARQVVHHILVHVIPKERAARAKERGGGGGQNGDGFFAAYVPGNNVLRFAEGFGKAIPKGATVRFQIHYTPNGTATNDQTELGIIFWKTKPENEVRVSSVAARLDIPPGEANYETRGVLPVPFDAKIMSFMPHMHVRGKAYKYELKLPNGEQKVLLDVPKYDFNWQLQYILKEHVDAPRGSQLIGTAKYDNSANNPANPDPTARVRWGEQTYEEMMLGYVEYYLPKTPRSQAKAD